MRLQNKLKQIENQLDVPINDKTKRSIRMFIDNLHKKPFKANDFNTLVSNIEQSYVKKSMKHEEYFIKNIAHTVNTKTNENLFDLKEMDLSKNFNSKINKDIAKKLENAYAKGTVKDKNIIKLSNLLETYKHKGNSKFIEKLDDKYGAMKYAKVKYLDYKNRHKIPAMLTFTLDNTYRKYVKVEDVKLGSIEGLKEIKKSANLQKLIEKSYEKLNEIFRAFYAYFKTLNKRSGDKDKLDFLLVGECHKSLTLHLHIVFYCNHNQLENLNRAWANYLKDLTPKQKKGQDKRIIDRDISTSNTYLAKYLIKDYNTEDGESNFFLKFKRYFSKLKLFRTSNFYHTTQSKINKIYSYLKKHYPDILEMFRQSDYPIYEILEKLEIEGIFIFEKEKIESISFDRKMMKEKYLEYQGKATDKYIKNRVIDSMDLFAKKNFLSRISSARFEYQHEKFIEVLEVYGICYEDFIGCDDGEDDFYCSGMYEMECLELDKSFIVANELNNS